MSSILITDLMHQDISRVPLKKHDPTRRCRCWVLQAAHWLFSIESTKLEADAVQALLNGVRLLPAALHGAKVQRSFMKDKQRDTMGGANFIQRMVRILQRGCRGDFITLDMDVLLQLYVECWQIFLCYIN